jgi:RNA polymerase sigma-70 factor, ECF subfamily
MSETSISLLDSLRAAPSEALWRRLVDLYTPLVRGWLRRYQVLEQDADDLVQEILAVVVRKLPQFERQPHAGAFRRWLLGVTVNCLREFWRSHRGKATAPGGSEFLQSLQELEDPASHLSRLWDQEHDRHVAAWLLEQIRPQFEAKTWAAFRRVAIEGIPPTQVAAEQGMSVNAVFIAKSRVMTQLRLAGAGLLD